VPERVSGSAQKRRGLRPFVGLFLFREKSLPSRCPLAQVVMKNSHTDVRFSKLFNHLVATNFETPDLPVQS